MDKSAHPRWDFTNLDRLPTDTPHPKLNALNAKINARNEEIELMFIQIECDRIDREENKSTKKPTKRRTSRQELFEDIDEATRQDLLNEGFDIE
jgi:hypothetical protein